MNELFYVQNVKQGCVSDSILWWKQGDAGYVYDIREAKVFTADEIDNMLSIKLGDKRAWPKDYIDERMGRCRHCIDMRRCNLQEAVQVEG